MATLTCVNQKGGFEMSGKNAPTEGSERDDMRRIRREVRQKLSFYRNVLTFIVVVGVLALIDWLMGDDWWVQWIAAIWGGFLLLDLLRIYVGPVLWGRDVEDRIVERELRRRGYPPQDPSSR